MWPEHISVTFQSANHVLLLHKSPLLSVCFCYGKTGTGVGLLQVLYVAPVSIITLTIYIHPGEWVSDWMSKRAIVCDLAGENFVSSVTMRLHLWLSRTLVFNGNHVRIWVTISSRVAAVFMKHSRGTYALVGIAASEFADNIHQAEICALLGC
jgi:hypothetical protein